MATTTDAQWPTDGKKAKWRTLETVGEGTYGPKKHGYTNLIFHVSKTGKRTWSYKYRYPRGRAGGTNREITFPFERIEDTLKKLADVRVALADGIDPMATRQVAPNAMNRETSFRAVARRCYAERKVSDERDVFQKLEKDVFPVFGDKPMSELTMQDVTRALDRIAVRGKGETVHRVRSRMSVVFKFAIAHELCERNLAADVGPRYPRPPTDKARAFKMVPLRLLPAFLKAIEGYERSTGGLVNKCAFQLMMLTGHRSKPVFLAEWSEFRDLFGEHPGWVCPAKKMKSGERYSAPLGRQAVQVLGVMRDYAKTYFDGCRGYVFPRQGRGADTQEHHLSDAAFRAAVKAMGFAGVVHPHGFRKLLSTVCHSNRAFRHEDIERCLSHEVESHVSATYDLHGFQSECLEIVQWYADTLDRIREAGTVDGILHASLVRHDEELIRERGDWDLYVATARRFGVFVQEGV